MPPWPPVPGQPFPKCLPPKNTTAVAAMRIADGQRRPAPWRRARRRATTAITGSAARTATASRAGIATDIATVAKAATGALSGAAVHCHPMVSCDHMAAPNQRKTARLQPSVSRLAVTWRRAGPTSDATPGDSRTGTPHRPATASRENAPPRMMSRVRAVERGRSSMSEISSSVNSSP